MIEVACGCGKKLMAKKELAGKRAKCPGCGGILIIPDSGELPTQQANPQSQRSAEARPVETAATRPVATAETVQSPANGTPTGKPRAASSNTHAAAPPRDDQSTQTASPTPKPQNTGRATPEPGGFQNYYRVLGIAPNAMPEEIKTAINRELRVWSNRVNAPQIERRQEAERMVKVLEEAERTLLDAVKRTEYDKQLRTSPPPERRQYDDAAIDDFDNLVEQGWQLLINGNIHDALYAATRATQLNENNSEAWALLGQARFRWGDTEDAIDAYKRAIRLRPNQASYYFDVGSVYESAQIFDNALQQYQRASQIDPAATLYRAAIGAILVKTEQDDEAIRILTQCVAEDPDNETYQWFLAAAYHDRSYQGWTHAKDEEDGPKTIRYATTRAQVQEAQRYIALAEPLKFDDPELKNAIRSAKVEIDSMLNRTFHGNRFVAGAAIAVGLIGLMSGGVLFGLYFLLCAGLYIASCLTPQYLVNRRVLKGGGMTGTHKFIVGFDQAGDDSVSGMFGGFLIGTVLTLIALPIVILVNYAKNYAEA